MTHRKAASAVTQVFIFANQPPTGELARLLAPEAGFEVLGWETDPEEAGRRVREIGPDVVIVAHEGETSDCVAAASRISQACPGIQVVEINLETCVLQIYGGESAVVEAVRQLMSVIQLRSGPAQ